MAEILIKHAQVQKDEFTRPVRIELFIDTETDTTYAKLSIGCVGSFYKYNISSSLVVKAEAAVNAKVLAQGLTQSNGFWNFVLTDTREPFSATGFKDLYDAEIALIKYFVLKNDNYPVTPDKSEEVPMSKSIWLDILNTRSLTVIGLKIENALGSTGLDYTSADLNALTSMDECEHLDEIYAIAHERLGQHEEAGVLRAYVKNKSQRASYFPHD